MIGEDRATSNGIFRKTKMCQFFLRGRCTRSAACVFAHGYEELQPLPDFHCTKLCPDLCETGRCDKGMACRFAHSTKELRSSTNRVARGGGKANDRAQAMRAAMAGGPPPVPGIVLRHPGAVGALASETPVLVAQGAVVIAHPLQAQAVQAVVVPCAHVSVAQPCPSVGGVVPRAEKSTSAKIRVGNETPPPPDFAPTINLADLEDALDASCKKASGMELDMTPDAWSRQSTDEGTPLLSEFSRQGTEDSAWPADKTELDDQQATLVMEMLEVAESSGDSPGGARKDKVSSRGPGPVAKTASLQWMSEAAGLGLAPFVKNTFIEVSDQEPARTNHRRVKSTGDLRSSCI